MSNRNTPAKSCTLRVIRSSSYGADIREVTDRSNQPIRFRSVRAAREGILWAAQEMDYLARTFYDIEIVTTAGEVIPVRESVCEFVVEWNRCNSLDNCIGARLERGEAVYI